MSNEDLPLYQSKCTEEEKEQTRAWYSEQVRSILYQEEHEIPSQYVKVRCSCGKKVGWKYSYRCLYCGIWFCASCAERHFGFRVPASQTFKEANHE